jgi:hypothetical protein
MKHLYSKSGRPFAVTILLLAMSVGLRAETESGPEPACSPPKEYQPHAGLYKLGPRQEYAETDFAKLVAMINVYIETHQSGPVTDHDITRRTFQAQVEPAFGMGWDWGSGVATSGNDQPDGSLVTWFAGDGTAATWKPYVVGVPCIFFGAAFGAPRDPNFPRLEERPALAATCRIWGVYDPILAAITDAPDTGRRMLVHKAIVLGAPADPPPDLRQRVDLAIALTEKFPFTASPLADVYVFAAEVFPTERGYAEKAVREIEKLLDPSLPDGDKDPRALLRRSEYHKADWEKRYLFLLGWVQDNFLQDYDKALAAYKRVYVDYKEACGYNDDAMMFSARILARLGRVTEAESLYKKLIESYPKGFWKNDAQHECYRLKSGQKPGPDWPEKWALSFEN